MLRFRYYDEFNAAGPGPKPLAYLIGKDQVTVPARIALNEGELTVEPPTDEAAALAIQFDADRAGLLTLQTCLLPNREAPYLLSLELARHRIMLILNAIEDWGLADMDPESEPMQDFAEARRLFTSALVASPPGVGEYTAEQARLAKQALVQAIEASEELTLYHAKQQLTRRYEAANASDLSLDSEASTVPLPAKIGCTVHNDQFAEPLQRILRSSFDFLCCPMYWDEMEAEEGQYRFSPTDRWIEWAVRTAKLPVVGGPLIDLASNTVPQWLHIWENDYKTLREFAYEHVKHVVTRYRKTVSRWIVTSGVNVNSEFSLTLDQMIDLTRLCVLLVRKLHPKAEIVVEVSQPFGEHGTHIERSVSPMLFLDVIKEAGVSLDGYALRLQFGDTAPGRTTRDLMQIARVIDELAYLDKPIHITSFGAPSAQTARASDPTAPGINPGRWRAPWCPRIQVEWMTRAFTVVLSKPQVHSVCWQCLYDTPAGKSMRYGGLISADGKAKPSLKRMSEITGEHRAGLLPSLLSETEYDLSESAIASAIVE